MFMIEYSPTLMLIGVMLLFLFMVALGIMGWMDRKTFVYNAVRDFKTTYNKP
jgi:heme/copper-type cytochrome/quinol oxidase subunit 1